MRDRYRNGAYSNDNPTWHEEDGPQKAKAVVELMRFGGIVSPKVVVDVGCGTGAVLYTLAQRFVHEWPDTHWEGWDIAKEPIRAARKREGGQLHFVSGDFLASERAADLLLCLDVFEHVADDLSFLEALRSRAPAMVFRIPLDLSVWDVLRPKRLMGVGPTYGHHHVYTRELALQRLELAGYRIAAERYHRIRRDGPRGLDRLRDGLGRVAPHAVARVLGGFSLMVLAEPR